MLTLTGYRLSLKQIYNRTARNEQFEEIMTQRMQADYPGNYQVIEAYDPERGYWNGKLVFESEQDEVWFKLRYK